METKKIVKSLRLCAEKLGCHRYIIGNCVENISFGKVLDEAADRLEELEEISENWCNLNDENMELLRKYREDITELKQQLSEKPEWVSVEEKMPEEKQELFMCLKDGEKFLVLRGFYENSEWCIYTGATFYTRCDDIPSFWAPAEIIEPPKPKEPTFKDVFLKAFPKATILDPAVTVDCCAVFPWLLNEKGCCQMDMTCEECWNQPYFEPEEEGEQE